MNAAEVLEQFRRLSFEEQYEVAQQISEELEEELPPEQIAVFERRAEKLSRNPENGIKWETICAELKGRLEKRRACRGK